MLNGDSYYETEKQRIDHLFELMTVNDSEFLAKLMVYSRNVANLRSISHILGVKLSETVKGSNYLKSALYKSYFTGFMVNKSMKILGISSCRN